MAYTFNHSICTVAPTFRAAPQTEFTGRLSAKKLSLDGFPDVALALTNLTKRVSACESRLKILEPLAQEEAARKLVRWWRTIMLVKRLENYVLMMRIYLEAKSHWDSSLSSLPNSTQ
jgi:hypothetical protein